MFVVLVMYFKLCAAALFWHKGIQFGLSHGFFEQFAREGLGHILSLFLVMVEFLWVSHICGTCDENAMVCYCWHLELGICLLMGCCYFYNAYPGGRKRLCYTFVNTSILTYIYQGTVMALNCMTLELMLGSLCSCFPQLFIFVYTHIYIYIHILPTFLLHVYSKTAVSFVTALKRVCTEIFAQV